jgi:hypothetical protein
VAEMSHQFIDNSLAREIIKSYLLSLVEPNPVNLSAVNEQEVTRANKAIYLANGITAARFNKAPINRSSFLAACFDATYEEPIEHLIIGYGIKYRNTTKVSSLHHVIGDERSVSPTQKMCEAIQRQITQVCKGEVLIFHNHPKWFLNVLMDNFPLASSTDRITATQLKFSWFQFLKTFFGNGDVKLYVGENGFVKEFVLPPFDQLVELYRQYGTPNNSFKAIA